MKQQMIAMVAALGLVAGLSGCEKPSDADCRKALANIRHLTGTDQTSTGGELEAAVRSCRGNGKKKTVKCAIEATTLDELRACGLAGGMDKGVPEKK
jgi:hypothetical protein